MRTSILRLLVLVAGFATLLSCSDSPTEPDISEARFVRLSATDVVMTVQSPSPEEGVPAPGGSSLQLSIEFLNQRGVVLRLERIPGLEWRSTDRSVVLVTSTGLMTAVDTGSAMVIAQHKLMSDTVRVKVITVPVASIVVAPSPMTLLQGDTAVFTASALDAAGARLTGRTISWSVGDPTVASVEGTMATTDGATYQAVVVGRGLGSTTVNASVDVDRGEGPVVVFGSADVTVDRQPVRTVAVTPENPSVNVDESVQLAAEVRDRFGNVLTDRVTTWSTLDPAFASASATGLVRGLGIGSARIVATSEGVEDTVTVTVNGLPEARALWVSAMEYSTAASIATIMEKARTGNLNIVYFQVRVEGDAYYASTLEPCAIRLCGALGRGTLPFDPLAVAVREAHARGLQLHAWINSMTSWSAPPNNSAYCAQLQESDPGNPRHMLLAHPEWAMVANTGERMTCANSQPFGFAYVSPGVPEVRTHLARVAAEIVRNYAVDGIHLDRMRYPSQFRSWDAPSLTGFQAINNRAPGDGNTDPVWNGFRRDLLGLAVKETYDSIGAVRPNVVLSAAVEPVFDATRWGWPTNSAIMLYFQNPRLWASGGYVDVVVPMTAYNINQNAYCTYVTNNPDWACLLDDHMGAIDAVSGRHTYITIGAARPFEEYERQIAYGRSKGVKGFAFSSYAQMNSRNSFALLAAGPFKQRAQVPRMDWKAGAP